MAGGNTYSFKPEASNLSYAAIKAYAYKFEEDTHARNWVIEGNRFSAKSTWFGEACPGVYIQAPDPSAGAWGGQVIGSKSVWLSLPGGPLLPSEAPPEDQTAKFSSLHNSVDSALRKFYDMPDGVLAEEEAEKGWKVVDGIAVEDVNIPLVEASPPSRDGNAELAGQFAIMESNMSEMSGTTIDSVQSFVSKLKTVLKNIAKLTALWNASLLSESSILKKTKASLVEACTDAVTACDKLSKGEDGSELFPKKTGKILNLLTSLVGLGTAKGFTDALAGATGVGTAFADEKSVTVDYQHQECKTADDILSIFDIVVSDIDAKFRNAEQAVADQMQKACSIAQGDNYVLTLDPAESVTQNTEVNHAKITKVADCLDNIKKNIDNAALGVSQQSMSSAVRRDSPAGNYYYGASGAFENLREIIHSLLTHLSWQVGEASINVRAAADLFEGTDADAQARLDQSAREVNEKNAQGGKPDFHMPWENQKDESAKREEQRKQHKSS